MSPTPPLPLKLAGLRRRLGVGDFVILLYAAAFARQYFWPVGNDAAAWALTCLLTAFAWLWHLRTKDEEGPTPAPFWLIVALPLAFFYALRAALPDMSWDVLDYRLVNAERALRGWPMIEGDFFPSRFPFNPAPDMALGLGRRLLGYRLGTVVNLLALVWAGTILEKLLRPFVARPRLRAAGVLLLILSEQTLFEVNNYMVDLLALPLLLEATRLAFKTGEDARARRRALVRVGLYLGAALAFKLTNLAFAAPLFLLCAYRLARSGRRFEWASLSWAAGAAALPLLPYTLYMYWQTGSPVFPLYNHVFQSPYWPAPDPRTERWGPVVDDPRFKNMRAWEVLLWPLLLPFRVEHTGGDLGPHWGRLSLAFLAAVVGALWRKADARVRQLSAATLAGALLWSAASGMHRYAMYVEAAGGLVLIYLITKLWQASAEPRRSFDYRKTFASVLVLVLVVQSASACVYGYEFEWGGRPAFFKNPRGHLREARHFLRDHSARAFLSEEERALLDGVEVWAQSGPLTGGYQLLLRPDAPQWCLFMPEFFSTEVARTRFARAVEAARGKRVYTLALTEHLRSSIENVQAAGLGVGRVTPLQLPYFSDRGRFHAASLVEVLPAGRAPQRRIAVTAASAPLPDTAFRAALRWAHPPPARARAGESLTLRVVLRNEGGSVWPALGAADNSFRLFLGNHWLDPAGGVLVNDDGRAPLPFDLAPGEEAEVPLLVRAPAAGEYVLEVDLLQESVTWFGLKGSATLKQKVSVEP
ncbi:MAG TPA: hypothetical protein VG148_02385 [Pyrinomonadaceae bacterium]|nr:hypothetical protein [Pyrinomonadaceae bacterium]